MNEVVERPMADAVGHCHVIFHIVGEVKFENSTRWKRRTNYGFWTTECTTSVKRYFQPRISRDNSKVYTTVYYLRTSNNNHKGRTIGS